MYDHFNDHASVCNVIIILLDKMVYFIVKLNI